MSKEIELADKILDLLQIYSDFPDRFGMKELAADPELMSLTDEVKGYTLVQFFTWCRRLTARALDNAATDVRQMLQVYCQILLERPGYLAAMTCNNYLSLEDQTFWHEKLHSLQRAAVQRAERRVLLPVDDDDVLIPVRG